MAIEVGDRVPEATLLTMQDGDMEEVRIAERIAGRKVVIFGLPGAFTGTCTTAHLPSFVRTADAFRAKGVDEIICIPVNDPFVTKAWADHVGAEGITMLSDPGAEFTKGIGMAFSVPSRGFYDRANRYAMLVEDGVVSVMKTGDKPGVCDVTAGETLLEAL